MIFIGSFKGVWSTPPANENKLNQAYRVNLDSDPRERVFILSFCRNIAMLFWSFLLLKAKHFKDLLVCQAKLDMIVNLSNGFSHQEWITDRFQAWSTSIGSLGRSTHFLRTFLHQDLLFSRSLPFAKASHLFNSWNENKPVKIGRDGQVIVSIRLTFEYSRSCNSGSWTTLCGSLMSVISIGFIDWYHDHCTQSEE